MGDIRIIRNAGEGELKKLGVTDWPVWTREASEFPWTYGERETCYFLEGEVEVTPEGGETVKMGKGDMVTFPKGMSCTWKILKSVRKHYSFG
jgi:uncharacterized cupin superfamily protein